MSKRKSNFMKNSIRVSVAMATFNGEKYIEEQLDSILKNLNNNDEIIISDDGSTDNTRSIIRNYNDYRIKLIDGPQSGVKQNFANAISKCSGDFIFLADQDDIWNDVKVKTVLNEFKKEGVTLVVHDAIVFDSESNNELMESFFSFKKSGKGIAKNIIRNSYIGCCMAFESGLKKYILPIPNSIEMHDQWIGIVNEYMYGKSIFIKQKLLKYRRHSNNASQLTHYPFIRMIKNRFFFIKELIKIRR